MSTPLATPFNPSAPAMDSDTIKRTYLVHAFDGWHEHCTTAIDAEAEARAYALDGLRYGKSLRAYLFALPNGAGNQPAKVEYNANRQPVNLPMGVAHACTLYVAEPQCGEGCTGCQGTVSPEIVRHMYAEIFAASNQQAAPAKAEPTQAEARALANAALACPGLHRAIISAVNLRRPAVYLHADGTYRVDTCGSLQPSNYPPQVERVWCCLQSEVEQGVKAAGSVDAYAARETCHILCRYGEQALARFAAAIATARSESWEQVRNRALASIRETTPNA